MYYCVRHGKSLFVKNTLIDGMSTLDSVLNVKIQLSRFMHVVLSSVTRAVCVIMTFVTNSELRKS